MPKGLRTYSCTLLVLVLGAVASLGVWLGLVDTSQGAQVSNRSDTMNNSAPSATSNHTIAFTLASGQATGNSLETTGWDPSTGATASDTLTVTFPATPDVFDLSTIRCGDVDLDFVQSDMASSISSGFNAPDRTTSTNCPASATSWGLLIDTTLRRLTFFTPTSVQLYVASGTQVFVRIGLNAADQESGSHAIRNPATSGTYNIAVAGTFGGSGTVEVAINSSVAVTVTIAESLTFQISGLPGKYTGTDRMVGCTLGGATDDEDSFATIQGLVTTTATTVPFDVVLPQNRYEGCQRLEIQTNAANGYTIYSRENNPLEASGGSVLDDTNCFGACTPTTTTLGNTDFGLGISCVNSATSASCSTSNPNWNLGQNWAPISAENKGLSLAKWSGLSSVTGSLVLAKVKYRLGVPPRQAAGTYTNIVSWIATPIY